MVRLQNQTNPPTKTKRKKNFDDIADRPCRMILKTKDKTSSFELCNGLNVAFAQILEQKIKKFIKSYGGEIKWNVAYVR